MCDWDSVSNYSAHLELFVSSCESSEWEDEEDDLFQDCFEMSGSATEVLLGTTPKMGRRSMALSDIDPKYVSQSGIWEASEVETSRGGSIRIQHLTAVSTGTRPVSTTSGSTFHGHLSSGSAGAVMTGSRFPKLEECAHFHYDIVDLPHLKFALHEDQVQRCHSSSCAAGSSSEDSVKVGEDKDRHSNFSIEVVSGGQCWLFRRTLANWIKLDDQLHRCVWDRNFSRLEDLESTLKENRLSVGESREVIGHYLERLTILPINQITCGTVLSWFEIDNRGRHIISSDDAALNTPAVAAALATKTYTAQAPDELSFRIGEMISVIDLPPPEESVWLRGKLTRESHEMGINFEVGFFPREFVEIIGEKVKFHTGVTPVHTTTRRLARVSVTSTTSSPIPDKPVLRKHGKIISFFRSMMSRPEKRVLQQKGILRERVFNCDLAEHLLNTGTEIPIILRTCAEFIEVYGISDGIYRVSGSLRNTQRLRRLFDADEVPNLAGDEGIRQDVHAVSSVLKQYFRELPNPLCTYQLYEKFVSAISPPSNKERFDKIKEVIKELPPPHYRTLEYLMLHLSKMTVYSDHTGMTPQNMAIVWAPNLIRCRDLEGGNASECKGLSNQVIVAPNPKYWATLENSVIVTEFVIRYAERFFGKDKSPLPSSSENSRLSGRPESLLLSSSSPMKLMSLEAAKEKLSNSRNYIEVGGGPSTLPPVYHTVIDTSKRRSGFNSRAAGGWKNFFSRNRSFSKGPRKTTASDIRVVMNTAMNLKDGTVPGFGNKLRPVRSEESLISSPYPLAGQTTRALENTLEVDESGDGDEIQHSTSSPASPVSDAYSLAFIHHFNHHEDPLPDDSEPQQHTIDNTKTHNRSISHDSYFETSMKRLGMIPTEIHEEESDSKLSLDISSVGEETLQKERSSAVYGDCDSSSSLATRDRSSFSATPSTSTASLRPCYLPMLESSSSNEETPAFHSVSLQVKGEVKSNPNSPAIRPKAKPRLSKLRDCQVQTSLTAVNDVGVSTMDEEVSSLDCGIQFEPLPTTSPSARIGSRKNLDIYQYPTFNEIEKYEVSQGELHFELDRNSSIDDSSTDTTPGVDPYSVTNIIYSPLLNDVSSPTESSSSSEEPCTVGDASPLPSLNTKVVNGQSSSTSTSPFYQHTHQDSCSEEKSQVDPSHYENVTTLIARRHENIVNVIPQASVSPPSDVLLSDPTQHGSVIGIQDEHEVKTTRTFTDDTQHYENLECLRQFHQADPPTTQITYESSVEEYVDENQDDSRHCEELKLKLEPSTHEQPTTKGDSDIVYENVRVPIECQQEFGLDKDPNPSTLTDCSETEVGTYSHMESHTIAELASPETSGSITEDSAYAEELVQDSENIIYLEIKDSSPVGTPEEESSKSSVPSPVSEESGEVGSPIVVDNPLYGLQSVDMDPDIISEQVQKMSQLYKEENVESPVNAKPETRCNSAPLNETGLEFVLPLVTDADTDSEAKNCSLKSCDSEPAGGIDRKNRKVTRTTSMVQEQQKLLLCKRLSEPSLNVPNSESEKGSWKYVDAKRLTHRKQSVKELLTKFESTSQESVSLSPCPSPTRATPLNTVSNNAANVNNGTSGGSSGPGLPRPVKLVNSADSNSCLRDRNNSRYQHHRFSMGDILMSQSMNSPDDKDSMNQSGSTMTRSDTFPELRNEASKENESNPLEYSDKRTAIPEKMLQLFEVANTMVDNSDPNTRERIEKYKNNRRLFLREKYSGLPRSESESLTLSSPGCKSSSTSSGGGAAEDATRDSSSSIESVFSILPTTAGMDRSSGADSPRKRALSEDASLHLTQNQFKAFKSEEEGSTSATLPLCYPDQKALPRGAVTPVTGNINKNQVDPKKETSCGTGRVEHPYPPLGYNSRLNIKSCPPESLRESEIISVTTTAAEVPTKCHWTSNPTLGGRQAVTSVESGKKIKDIAAFFERKQF